MGMIMRMMMSISMMMMMKFQWKVEQAAWGLAARIRMNFKNSPTFRLIQSPEMIIMMRLMIISNSFTFCQSSSWQNLSKHTQKCFLKLYPKVVRSKRQKPHWWWWSVLILNHLNINNWVFLCLWWLTAEKIFAFVNILTCNICYLTLQLYNFYNVNSSKL